MKKAFWVYYIAADDQVMIAGSVNPWARLREIRATHQTAELIAMEPGTKDLVTARRGQFSHLATVGGWFACRGELAVHLSIVAS